MTDARILVLVLSSLLTIFIYVPGLSGTFVFDDETNIINNKELQVEDLTWSEFSDAAMSGESGPLKRPLSMFSFALNLATTGYDPFYFKLTNLVLHVLNGLSLFILSQLILKLTLVDPYSQKRLHWMAGLISIAWLVHPINLTSVLYVVQRMTSLSAFFTIWSLVFFLLGRISLIRGDGQYKWMFLCVLFAMLLSLMSKENGVLLPLYMVGIELSILKFSTVNNKSSSKLKGFYVGLFLLPIIFIVIFAGGDFEWLRETYKARDFGLVERLLTESRVLVFYLRLILMPDITLLGLYHDDLLISRGLFQPVSTFFSILLLSLLILLTTVKGKNLSVFKFCVLFFLFGHALESTFLPLEIIHEHRNYLPGYGIIFGLIYYLFNNRFITSTRVSAMVACLAIALFGTVTYLRATSWGDAGEFTTSEVRHHPLSSRANYQQGMSYLYLAKRIQDERYAYFEKAKYYFVVSSELNPSFTVGLFNLIQLSVELNKVVDPRWIDDLLNRLENERFEANTVGAIDNVVSCNNDKGCFLPPLFIQDILKAVGKNKMIPTGLRGEVLMLNAKFYANIERDFQKAVDLMKKATTMYPRNKKYRAYLSSLEEAVSSRSGLE